MAGPVNNQQVDKIGTLLAVVAGDEEDEDHQWPDAFPPAAQAPFQYVQDSGNDDPAQLVAPAIEQALKPCYLNARVISINGSPQIPKPSRPRPESFVRLLDWALLFDGENAFSFTGERQNRENYARRNMYAPEDLVKSFLVHAPKKFALEPSSPGPNNFHLTNIMITFWIMRAEMWRRKYGSVEQARAKWWPKTYNEEYWNLDNSYWAGFQDLVSLKAAMTVGKYPLILPDLERPDPWHFVKRPDHLSICHMVQLDKVSLAFAYRVL